MGKMGPGALLVVAENLVALVVVLETKIHPPARWVRMLGLLEGQRDVPKDWRYQAPSWARLA